jgi:hypothetical protein
MYMGKDMFMMQRIGRHKLAPGINLAVIATYNNMHACIFFKTTISFHLYLMGFRNFKVRVYILGFWVWF